MSLGTITIQSPGLDKLTQRFPVKVKKVIRESLKDSALLVQNKAKRLAPYLTGHLRRNITNEVRMAEAKVGSDVIYARVREFNTKSRPNGYLRPAVTKNTKKIVRIFERNINTLIKYKYFNKI